MRCLALSALLLTIFVSALALADEETAEAGKKLEGKWVVENAVRNKGPAKELKGGIYEIRNGEMTFKPTKEGLAPRSATYELRKPEKKEGPIRIVITPQEGPLKGDKLPGILRFKKDGM